MNPLETYIRELRDIRSSGEAVAETSYYGALASLFNEVGKALKPKVRCVITIKNRGAGIPDGGLFTSDQFQKPSGSEPIKGQAPSRGVIEVKPASSDVWVTADGAQVSKYWGKYGQVVVTNYRDFVLVGRDEEGRAAKLETYRLAPTESEFWSAALNPRRFAEEHGERFIEYLKRVMLQGAQLASPEDVAWFLASYARDAKARIERAELPALAAVRAALEEALGLKFEGNKGERFFRSTLVQTLFYGVFSAWVLWSKERGRGESAERFDWKQAAWSLRVPMISALFEQVAMPSRLGPLGLVEALDWTAAALNRVVREEFFKRFEEEHAVQYFYEPFLEAFDPLLRKELGVWYTPKEIVEYMVARVDRALREELDLPDGLADPRVYVLDPCCGTGAYLVEVLRRIAVTLRERGDDALVSNDIKRAAKERVFGFEILPAPFVVAHLQLGLMLQNLSAPLGDDRAERVGVYLTNALTGWEPPKGPKQHLMFKEMEEERDAAEHVKRDVPILVVLGNPPYNAFAGVSPEEEQGLVEAYKKGLISEWAIKKFNLDDLYIRFFRLAERRIAGKTGEGVVCYISNFSYLSDPSFVVMRKRFLAEFDSLWFDSLNGDSRETGKLTPEGKPDPSVFSTQYNREGIRVGTAIGLMVRKHKRNEQPIVRSRQFWGVTKRDDLLESLRLEDLNAKYEIANPENSNRFSFRPSLVEMSYLAWPKLVDLCSIPPLNGPIERRANALISIDPDILSSRIKAYFDASVSDEAIKSIYPSLMMTGNRIVGPDARKKILNQFEYNDHCIVRYPFKPFDVRWCYLENLRPLFSEPSPQLLEQRFPGNTFFVTRDMADKDIEGVPFYFSPLVCDYHSLAGEARHFPVRILKSSKQGKKETTQENLFAETKTADATIANLSQPVREYLASLGINNPDADAETAGLIWMHALAIGYAPAYLNENAVGIRQDWPRAPLPDSKQALEASSSLGREIAALLDTETPTPNVTTGAIRAELKTIAVISSTGGASLDPDAGDLALTAGWGHSGKGGITMPGKGKIVARDYTGAELEAIAQGASALNLSTEVAITHLGESALDIYLNENAYWKNVPARVWDYTIGGYQVIKKWLSYREKELLGRAITANEAREVMTMARRIAAILLLEPALDANYESVKQSVYAWRSEKGKS